jgi:hypothetical protein
MDILKKLESVKDDLTEEFLKKSEKQLMPLVELSVKRLQKQFPKRTVSISTYWTHKIYLDKTAINGVHYEYSIKGLMRETCDIVEEYDDALITFMDDIRFCPELTLIYAPKDGSEVKCPDYLVGYEVKNLWK